MSGDRGPPVPALCHVHREIGLATETQTAFFSYSRDDSEFALRLAEDLKAAGAAVWLDQLDIAPGQRWARAVQDALNNCHRLLIILSPSSVNSTNVEDEVAFALEEHKTVIPVLYRDCKVPFQLRPFQYVDFRTDYARGLRALLKVLGVAKPPDRGIPMPPTVPKGTQGGVWNVRATEEARREEERKRAAEQARLEEGRKRWAEEDRLEKERKRIAEQARLETMAREKIINRPASGSNFLSTSPSWVTVAAAMCGILIVASVLYWALSRPRSSEQTGEAHKQQGQVETPNPQAPNGNEAAKEMAQKQQAPGSSPNGSVSTRPPLQPPSGEKNPPTLPPMMHFCGQHCISLKLDNGHYVNTTTMPGSPNWTSVWTAERFTSESVILHRVDSDAGKTVFTGTYTGQISPEGNSLINVAGDGHRGNLRITWGTALNSIPGSDATPPPQKQGPKVSVNNPGAALRDLPAAKHPGCPLVDAENLPTKLTECESGQCVPGGGGPGDWTFNGRQGHGEWRLQGAKANLTIERFDFDSVVIRREDVVGRTPGITAIYTGKIQGNRIEGNVTWSWPGHWNKSPSSTWYATVLEPANYALIDPKLCP